MDFDGGGVAVDTPDVAQVDRSWPTDRPDKFQATEEWGYTGWGYGWRSCISLSYIPSAVKLINKVKAFR